MNNLEYLNEISKSNRSEKKTASSTTSLIFKILGGGIAAFIFLMIIGSILSSSSTPSTSDLTKQIYLRTNNLNTTVTTYNRSLKSSALRAISSSLSTTLTGASSQLTSYFSATGINPTPNSKISESESAQDETLNTTLNNAKLNGILDRIYASQIQLQVSLLLSLLSQDLAHTKDANLYAILEQYNSNLVLIEQSLDSL